MRQKKPRGATPKTAAPTKSSAPPTNKPKATTADQQIKHATLNVWFIMHYNALANAFKRLSRAPLATLLTIMVVGVALSLPAALQVVIKNLATSQQALNEQAGISLFLKPNVPQTEINQLLENLQQNPMVEKTSFKSATEAWQEFQSSAGFQNSTSLLDNNPLPALILVLPKTRDYSPEQVEKLATELQNLAPVDIAQVDINWVKRLFSIVEFFKHSAIYFSVFLIFTVLIVIGNTIKMLGQSFQDEIVVSKLVGATDGFVRRPFLYSGMLYGLAGGICALSFVFIGIFIISPQLNEIAELYQTRISIIGLNFSDILSLLITGIILGLGGAWVAANRMINNIAI